MDRCRADKGMEAWRTPSLADIKLPVSPPDVRRRRRRARPAAAMGLERHSAVRWHPHVDLVHRIHLRKGVLDMGVRKLIPCSMGSRLPRRLHGPDRRHRRTTRSSATCSTPDVPSGRSENRNGAVRAARPRPPCVYKLLVDGGDRPAAQCNCNLNPRAHARSPSTRS